MDRSNDQNATPTHTPRAAHQPASPRRHPTDPALFDFGRPLVRIPRDAILDGLRRFAAERGTSPLTTKAFDRWPARPCSSGTVKNHFGSWDKGLRAIGCRAARVFRYTPEELIDILETVWRKLGRRPGNTTLNRYASISPMPYVSRWGSVEAACRVLEAFHKGRISRAELLHPRANRAPRRGPSPRVRLAILQRDHFRCTLCGRGPNSTPPAELEVDHIVPLSKGGSNDESNLRVLCWSCNNAKGAHPDPSRATSSDRLRPNGATECSHG